MSISLRFGDSEGGEGNLKRSLFVLVSLQRLRPQFINLLTPLQSPAAGVRTGFTDDPLLGADVGSNCLLGA
jgi:hypothetical protein